MPLDPSTSALLDTLDSFSGGKLTRRNDLGTVIQLAEFHRQGTLLESLSFLAKFVSKTHGIMNRIGKDGQGYETLEAQFSENLTRAREQMQQLVNAGPPEIQKYFTEVYFAMTQDALQNLLELFYDLSWYKNWQIDHPVRSA